MNPIALLQAPRKFALWIISIIVTLSTIVSLTESYRALYIWATNHQVFGNFAYIWPLMIDSFIVVGELTLFVSMTDRWNLRARLFPWAVTLCGLAVSVAGNVGHVHTHDVWTRLTAAVAPMAASASLTVGMGVLKRVVHLHHSTAQAEYIDLEDDPDLDDLDDDQPDEHDELEQGDPRLDDAEALPAGSQPSLEYVKPARPASHAAPRTQRTWSRNRSAQAHAELGQRKLGVTPRQGQRNMVSIDSA